MKQHNTLRTRIMAGLLMAGMVLGSTAAQAQSGPAPTTASGFRMYNSSTNWITIRAGATSGTGTFFWPAPAAGIFKSDPTGIMSIGLVQNTDLQNNSVTINTGTGLSGGGVVALGGTLNLANTGVTSLLAGPGIGVSGATGAVTVANTGVLSAIGTPNQVNVSSATGNVTFSLPQNIDQNATPTFNSLILDAVTPLSTSSAVLVLGAGNVVEQRTMNIVPSGTTINATLVWNGTAWVENNKVLMNPTTGDVNIALGDVNINGGDLTVTTGDVDFPDFVINNNELQNSSVTINTLPGSGLAGGGNVALGGTLNLTNAGVTSLAAGPGISVSGSTGAVTVNNTGVLSAIGTPNQVSVSSATGNVTFSLPQNIDMNATPTFNSAILDALTTNALLEDVLVVNAGGLIEKRTIEMLPTGTSNHTTLVWDHVNTKWIENTQVTMNPVNGNITTTGSVSASDLNVTNNTTLGNDALDNITLVAGNVTATNLPPTAVVPVGGGVLITNAAGTIHEIQPNDLFNNNVTLNQNNIWVGDATNKPSQVAPGTAGQVLQIVGSTPTYQTLDGTDLSLTHKALVVGDATNKGSELPTTNTPGAVLTQNASGVPTWVAPAGSIAAHGVVTGTGTWTYTVPTGAVNPTGKAIIVTAGSTGGSGSAPQMTVGVSNVTAGSFDIELPINIDATVKLSWTVIN